MIRGATYLLAIIHYGVGQGGMAYFLHRRRGVPLARSAGAVMLTMGVNPGLAATLAVEAAVRRGAHGAPAGRGGARAAHPGAARRTLHGDADLRRASADRPGADAVAGGVRDRGAADHAVGAGGGAVLGGGAVR